MKNSRRVRFAKKTIKTLKSQKSAKGKTQKSESNDEIEEEHYLTIYWSGVTTILTKGKKQGSLIVKAVPLNNNEPQLYQRSIALLKPLENYYGFWNVLGSTKADDPQDPHIVLDFVAGGEVDRLFYVEKEDDGKYPVEGYDNCQDAIIIYGVARLLDFMHTQLNLVHGDISSYTVFVDHNLRPIIAPIRQSYKNNHILRTDFVAPEVKQSNFSEESFTKKADVYSVGMLAMAFAKHNYPVTGRNRGEGESGKKGKVSSPFVEIFDKCTKENPDERPEMSEIVNDMKNIGKKFGKKFSDYVAFLESNVGKKPTERLGSLQNLENAAKKNIPFALETYGEMLMEGDIVKRNEKRGEEMIDTLDDMTIGSDEEDDDDDEEYEEDDDDGNDDDDDDDDLDDEFDDDCDTDDDD